MAQGPVKQEFFEWPDLRVLSIASSHEVLHLPSPCAHPAIRRLQRHADYRTLQKRGFSVFAFDAHSFGKSEPLEPAYMRSYVLSPHHLVDDVYSYVRVSCLSGLVDTGL